MAHTPDTLMAIPVGGNALYDAELSHQLIAYAANPEHPTADRVRVLQHLEWVVMGCDTDITEAYLVEVEATWAEMRA